MNAPITLCGNVHKSGAVCQLNATHRGKHNAAVLFEYETSHEWDEIASLAWEQGDGDIYLLGDDDSDPYPFWTPGQWTEKNLSRPEPSILTNAAERNALFFVLCKWALQRRYEESARFALDCLDYLQGWIAHCNHVSLDDALDAREKHPILDAGRFDPESFAHGHCARANWAATRESKEASNEP